MALSEIELQRLAWLQQPEVPIQFIRDLYGVDCANDRVIAAFGAWLASRGKRAAGTESANRHQLETFLQVNRLEAINFAAARLGMTAGSLREVLEHLSALGLTRQYEAKPGLIEEELKEDLIRTLKTVRHRTFGDHSSFCERLHADISEQLGLDVQKLWCATTQWLDDQREYANTFDYITLEPLSTRHQVVLDTGKPMNLALDRCSKRVFVDNYQLLRPLTAGSREPEDLDRFLPEAVAGTGGGGG